MCPLAIRVRIKLGTRRQFCARRAGGGGKCAKNLGAPLDSIPSAWLFVARSKADSAWNTLRGAAGIAPRYEFHRMSVFNFAQTARIRWLHSNRIW
jgi:hypothetical protein